MSGYRDGPNQLHKQNWRRGNYVRAVCRHDARDFTMVAQKVEYQSLSQELLMQLFEVGCNRTDPQKQLQFSFFPCSLSSFPPFHCPTLPFPAATKTVPPPSPPLPGPLRGKPIPDISSLPDSQTPDISNSKIPDNPAPVFFFLTTGHRIPDFSFADLPCSAQLRPGFG